MFNEGGVAAMERGAEELITFRAAAGEKLAKAAAIDSSCDKLGRRPQQFGSAAASLSKQDQETVGKKTSLQLGFEAWSQFGVFAKHRFGNPVRLWFEMDPEESMRIGAMQFARACEEMGFKGNVRALWRYLDRDNSGQITIQELDNSSAVLLAGFKSLLDERFGGSVERLMRVVDGNNSNRVTKAEFVSGVRKTGYPGPARRLFDLLTRHAGGFIAEEDLGFLEHWRPPSFLLREADKDGLATFRHVLMSHHHQNMLLVWFRVFDRRREMRLSWDDWSAACTRFAARHPSEGLADSEGQFGGMWRALDEDCAGWIALRRFEWRAFAVLEKVKKWLSERYGGLVSKALAAARLCRSGSSSADLVAASTNTTAGHLQTSRGAFRAIVRREVGFCRADIDYLCEGLDLKDGAMVAEADLKFLEKWDIALEDLLLRNDTGEMAVSDGTSDRPV